MLHEKLHEKVAWKFAWKVEWKVAWDGSKKVPLKVARSNVKVAWSNVKLHKAIYFEEINNNNHKSLSKVGKE